MEPPAAFEAETVRDEKVKVLDGDRRRPTTGDTVRGQYTRRRRRAARPCPATATRRGSPPDSLTETYVALKLQIDNWRWAGVPFYLRTGKRLPRA